MLVSLERMKSDLRHCILLHCQKYQYFPKKLMALGSDLDTGKIQALADRRFAFAAGPQKTCAQFGRRCCFDVFSSCGASTASVVAEGISSNVNYNIHSILQS